MGNANAASKKNITVDSSSSGATGNAVSAIASDAINKSTVIECTSDPTTKTIDCNLKLRGQMESFGNKMNSTRDLIIKALLLFTFVLFVISLSNDFRKLNCIKRDNYINRHSGYGQTYTDDEKPDNIIVLI
jgi:hypothetical protein